MPNIGASELIIIMLILVVLFGGSRIANLGTGLGKGIRNFKKALSGEDDEASKLNPPSSPNSEDGKKTS